MTMELAAERPGQLLFRDDRTLLGTVYSVRKDQFSGIALPFESFVARGYWVEPSPQAVELAALLNVPTAEELVAAKIGESTLG